MTSVDYLIISYATLPFRRPRSYQIGKLLKNIKGRYFLITCDSSKSQELDFSLESYIAEEEKYVLRITDYSSSLWFKILLKIFPFLCEYPDRFWYWGKLVVMRSKILAKQLKPRVIIAFARPMRDLLIGIELKKIYKVPLVVHFADPWVDNPYFVYKGIKRKVNGRLEYNVMKSADLILFTSEDQKNLIMKKYPQNLQNKAKSIEHCYDEKLYGFYEKTNDRYIVRHIGNLYKQRSAEAFLKALYLLIEEHEEIKEKILVEFYGDVSENVIRAITKYSLGKIVNVKPYIPYLKSLELMSQSDLLLLIDASSSHNTFFPSKLVDYIGSKRNILGITSSSGPSARIIEAYGGKNFTHQEVKMISNYLLDQIRNTEKFRPNNKEMVKYSATVVSKKFEKLVNSILN